MDAMMLAVHAETVIDAPAAAVLEEWVQLDGMAEVLEGVDAIRHTGRGIVVFFGEAGQWSVRFVEGTAHVVAWRTIAGPRHDYRIRCAPSGGHQTTLSVRAEFDEADWPQVSDVRRHFQQRLEDELARFEAYIQKRLAAHSELKSSERGRGTHASQA